jgi:hypothetical protein
LKVEGHAVGIAGSRESRVDTTATAIDCLRPQRFACRRWQTNRQRPWPSNRHHFRLELLNRTACRRVPPTTLRLALCRLWETSTVRHFPETKESKQGGSQTPERDLKPSLINRFDDNCRPKERNQQRTMFQSKYPKPIGRSSQELIIVAGAIRINILNWSSATDRDYPVANTRDNAINHICSKMLRRQEIQNVFVNIETNQKDNGACKRR